MDHQLPPVKNISALGFNDYVRIRRLVKHDGKSPTIEVTQHDKDTVTYYEAYQALLDVSSDQQAYSMHLNEYTTNLVSALCTMLYQHKVLSEAEIKQIGNIAEKLWQENKGE